MLGVIRHQKFTSAPKLKKGPKGIASLTCLPRRIITKSAYTKPKKEPITTVVMTPCHPMSEPIPAISLTSPPPMASFLNSHVPIRAIASTPKSPTPAPNSEANSFSHHRPEKLGLHHANATPSTIIPKENRSGMIINCKSITDKIIRKYTAVKSTNVQILNPYFHTNNTVSSPVNNSTSGYCQEIGALQWRHFPRKNKKLSTGILSYHRM